MKELLKDVLSTLESFSYEENQDRPSNSFFTAELSEDGFFMLIDRVKKALVRCDVIKATQKKQEAFVVSYIMDIGASSLDPESYGNLEEVIGVLCSTRNITKTVEDKP